MQSTSPLPKDSEILNAERFGNLSERISKLADVCEWGAEGTGRTPREFCEDVVSRCEVPQDLKTALVEGVSFELNRRAERRGEAAL